MSDKTLDFYLVYSPMARNMRGKRPYDIRVQILHNR